MILTTTPSIEGKSIRQCHGIVTGEAIVGANIFKDFFAGIRDIVGGHSAAYEKELAKARAIATQEVQEAARALQRRPAPRRPLCRPAIDRLPMHPHASGDFGFRVPLVQESGGLHPPTLQRLEITRHSSGIAHAPECSRFRGKCHYIL